MPVDSFALLRGATQPVATKHEAEKVWEPLFIGEVVAGKNPRRPPRETIDSDITVATFLDTYYEQYVEGEPLRSKVTVRSRIGILKEYLGDLPVTELERAEPIEQFKRKYGAKRALATTNRALSILRHAINWGRGRTPPILHTSPFHRFGVRIKTRHEVKRTRRVLPAEEKQLLRAAEEMDCAEHLYAGGPMRDRIIGALDTGCRQGEMLRIQNRDVLWDTHQIDIRAEHTKDFERRRIPFDPNGRLAEILVRRRALGPTGYVSGRTRGSFRRPFAPRGRRWY